MDRSLDEIIGERPPRSSRPPRSEPRRPPPRAPRREEYPRDGVRKSLRDEPANLDTDWVHDRYDERDRNHLDKRGPVDSDRRPDDQGTKLRVDNVHYELTEADLRELFARIGRLVSVKLLYDRHDRSEGTAFVTYADPRDARDAIADFDGCNANGQPIRLTLLPTAPAAAAKGTLFDRVERPSRSLFDRIERAPDSRDDSREDTSRRRRHRSDSPRRRSPPENIDRYVPGGRRASRSPIKRRGTPRDSGRRPGQRREDSGRPPRGGRGGSETGRQMIGGRPKKTAEELDAEMADYWGSKPAQNGAAATQNNTGAVAAATQAVDDDIDMIE